MASDSAGGMSSNPSCSCWALRLTGPLPAMQATVWARVLRRRVAPDRMTAMWIRSCVDDPTTDIYGPTMRLVRPGGGGGGMEPTNEHSPVAGLSRPVQQAGFWLQIARFS